MNSYLTDFFVVVNHDDFKNECFISNVLLLNYNHKIIEVKVYKRCDMIKNKNIFLMIIPNGSSLLPLQPNNNFNNKQSSELRNSNHVCNILRELFWMIV